MKQNCPDRKQLKQYSEGWTDEATAQRLEQHRAECSHCEQTLAELDSELDTEVVRPSSNITPSQETSDSCELPSQIRQTVAEIREWKLMPVPISHAEQESTATGDTLPGLGDFGNYQLLELIGRGGMAEVYRAMHKRLQKEVAVKLIRVPRRFLAESLGRIDREMQAMGRLNHPAIVRAMDAGECRGVPYLATEFIDGLDVGRIAKSLGPLDIAEACAMIHAAALGLDYAHAQGIIHRDIKPSNLMLDSQGQIRILDFGLVHLDDWSGPRTELTTVGQLLGTLDYMAPEQAERPDAVSHHSDVYALGATLFKLLCGRAPYAASPQQSPLEKLRLLASQRAPHVATLRPDLPNDLAQLVDQTLEREPSARPASAAHFAERVKPFCQGADLIGLLERAKQTEEKPDFDSAKGVLDDPWPTLSGGQPTREENLRQNRTERGPDNFSHETTAPVASNHGSRGRRFGWLLAAAALPFLIWAGIIIVLETQKGQVVIETDVPNLQVELVADGKVRQEIELVPGENSTRVYAGEYEIRIGDGADRYVLEQNTFVLKRGDKVVAKISVNQDKKRAAIAWSGTRSDVPIPREEPVGRNELAAKSDATQSPTEPGVDNQNRRNTIPGFPELPVYEGRTIGDWLWIAQYETSSELKGNASRAARALSSNPPIKTAVNEYWIDQISKSEYELKWIEPQIGSTILSDERFADLGKLFANAQGTRKVWLLDLLLKFAINSNEKSQIEDAMRLIKSSTTQDWPTDERNRGRMHESLLEASFRIYNSKIPDELAVVLIPELLQFAADNRLVPISNLVDRIFNDRIAYGVSRAHDPYWLDSNEAKRMTTVLRHIFFQLFDELEEFANSNLEWGMFLSRGQGKDHGMEISLGIANKLHQYLLKQGYLSEPMILPHNQNFSTHMQPTQSYLRWTSELWKSSRFDFGAVRASSPPHRQYRLRIPVRELLIALASWGALDDQGREAVGKIRDAVAEDAHKFEAELQTVLKQDVKEVLANKSVQIRLSFEKDSDTVGVSILGLRSASGGDEYEDDEGLGGGSGLDQGDDTARGRTSSDRASTTVSVKLAVAYLIYEQAQAMLQDLGE
ncbi:MAG: serine/threonine protein kinase [Pirellulaceae bacterium]|nr:serine/threonine protein kinase [Pirellulaceae bacterium]